MTADVNNFYLNTRLDRPEYMIISVKIIPEELMEEYQGDTFVEDGYIYFEINKVMYGLPQSGSQCMASAPHRAHQVCGFIIQGQLSLPLWSMTLEWNMNVSRTHSTSLTH